MRSTVAHHPCRKYVSKFSSFGGSACFAESASGWSEVACECGQRAHATRMARPPTALVVSFHFLVMRSNAVRKYEQTNSQQNALKSTLFFLQKAPTSNFTEGRVFIWPVRSSLISRTMERTCSFQEQDEAREPGARRPGCGVPPAGDGDFGLGLGLALPLPLRLRLPLPLSQPLPPPPPPPPPSGDGTGAGPGCRHCAPGWRAHSASRG